MYCDEVQVLLGIFQQIASALNRCIYCLLERRILQKKTRSSIERSIVSENWIKQLHTLPVLHVNRWLAHFNGNFDTDNQIYVP
jgi:hypothetical protein